MSDAIEEKWPKSLVGGIIFLFILIIALATVVPNNMIDKAMESERAMAERLMSTKDLERIVSKTDSVYISLVINSGARDAIANVFMPSGPATVDAFERKASIWFNYLANRGEALQKITYQIIYRLVLAAYWIPFFVVVAIPAVFAGYMRWNAKRYGFDYSSPFLNNNAVTTLSWGIIILLVGTLFPAPLPPLLVCTILVAVMPSILSIYIANLPKRI